MNKNISFFTAVDYSFYLGDLSAFAKLTQWVDSYFYLGGKMVRAVEKELHGNRIAVLEHEADFTFIGTAVKVISYVSIIIPLIMLCAKLLLRNRQSYEPLNDKMKLEKFSKLKNVAVHECFTLDVKTQLNGKNYYSDKTYANILGHLPPILLWNDQNSSLNKRGGSRSVLETAHPFVRRNEHFARAVIDLQPSDLQFADESLKKDPEFILKLLDSAINRKKPSHIGSLFKYMDASLKKDKEFILNSTQKNKISLKHADESLKKDPKFILKIIERAEKSTGIEELKKIFKYADTDGKLRKDRQFMLDAISHNARIINCADVSLARNSEFIFEAIEKNPSVLLLLDQEVVDFDKLHRIHCQDTEELLDDFVDTEAEDNEAILFVIAAMMRNPNTIAGIDERCSEYGLEKSKELLKPILKKLFSTDFLSFLETLGYSDEEIQLLMKEMESSFPEEYKAITSKSNG